ncbi:MAG TPA: SDR family NAD(P)-dependent oxidoreductase [Stellaceae bacterium]|nr:SDR family NAD(P)-dependent oxidoreductase [Stellaceae bacterium]
MTPHLFCFGFGYTARALARRLAAAGWRIGGTCRPSKAATAAEVAALPFARERPLPPDALVGVTHILVSIPPDAEGDPVLDRHGADIAALPGLAWVGYLSTTGVYGDRGGAWVDESAPLAPTGERGRRRVAAEAGWLMLWRTRRVPVHVFRLAAIYGPGRNPFAALRAGTAKRIDRPGQVFSRIHVEDLAAALSASIARPRPGAVYNVCDDEPAPPAAVVAHAARLLDLPPPPLVPFAAAELSPLAQSFYADNKRVSNALLKRELGVRLRYPDYRAGLAAIRAAELSQNCLKCRTGLPGPAPFGMVGRDNPDHSTR